MKRVLLIIPLLWAQVALGGTMLSFCVVDGETGLPAASVELVARETSSVLSPGYTDANGCHETDFLPIVDINQVELDLTSREYLPWYGYPTWNCELIYPASPPFVSCSTTIRLVPREYKNKKESTHVLVQR